MTHTRQLFLRTFCDTCQKPRDHDGCGRSFRQILEPIRCPEELSKTHAICPFCLDLYAMAQRHEQLCALGSQKLTLHAGGWATPASADVLRSIRRTPLAYREPLVNLVRLLLTEVKAEDCLIVPLPMSSAGRIDRWTEIVQKAASSIKGALVAAVILRDKQVSTRKSLAQMRAKIAQKEYRIEKGSKAIIKDRRVVLIDDNVTTGITMAHCASLILSQEPQKLLLLTIDRTLPARALQRCPQPRALTCRFHIPAHGH